MRKRYRGCLLGVAVGDMIGAPFEGMRREEIPEDLPDLRVPFCTDDTHMTLAIAESICERRCVDLSDISERFLRWYLRRPAEAGLTTRTSIEALISGFRWNEAGERTYLRLGDLAAGNGSAMRTAPIALFLACHGDEMVRAAVDVSRITHAHPLSIGGAVSICITIRNMLESEMAHAIRTSIRQVERRFPDVARAMRRGLTRPPSRPTSHILSTLQAVFHALSQSSDLTSAVLNAVRMGGDTDTYAAIAGSLAGVQWGENVIPKQWINALEQAGVSTERIRYVADRIFELSGRCVGP